MVFFTNNHAVLDYGAVEYFDLENVNSGFMGLV